MNLLRRFTPKSGVKGGHANIGALGHFRPNSVALPTNLLPLHPKSGHCAGGAAFNSDYAGSEEISEASTIERSTFRATGLVTPPLASVSFVVEIGIRKRNSTRR